ncbi:alpha/beta fold hydrolase [Parahaliea aestuarii]|uniref:Alpha/beta hydrolase n=1 Tax=Parahaliea aestuarii TaxID=1852021 RepID=A0A5C8ZXY1_9GAMM|nr:alpha/beta hydrolase [Parahaliea aestuarii]TXS92452.1 alpha/beta hydrolase [Parahaliea aestuarii]
MAQAAFQHHFVEQGDITLHCVSAGQGPLVLLAHGFPGLWYSWRHQLPALAEAGYRAVALDMRGYGDSSRPLDSDAYRFDHLAADLFAVQACFGQDSAVLVGHDFGANLAWHMGLHHPQRISAIAALASPRGMPLAGGGDVRPSELFAGVAAQHFFHMHYFQQPGVAEADLAGCEESFLRRLFWALGAEGDLLDWTRYPSGGTTYMDVLAEPPRALPWDWMSEADFATYLSAYLSQPGAAVFAGGLNSYRAMDANWGRFRERLFEPLPCPALFIAGESDPVIKLCPDDVFERQRELVPDLRGDIRIPSAGHFVQQEQPQATNAALLTFLRSL